MIAPEAIRTGSHRPGQRLSGPIAPERPVALLVAVDRARIAEAQVEIDLGDDQLQRDQQTAADSRRPLQLQAIDRGQQIVAVLGRGLDHGGGAGERHDPDVDVARFGVDERTRSGLGGLQPRGLDVARPHAARDVDRQHDRLVIARQRDDRRRPRDREDEQRQRDEEQQRRHMSAEARARTHRFAHQRQARIAQRNLALAPQQQQVGADQDRHQDEQPQQLRPQEAHRGIPRSAAGRRRRHCGS